MNPCFVGDRGAAVLSSDLVGDRGAASAWFWISPRAAGGEKLEKAMSCCSGDCGMAMERGLGSAGVKDEPSEALRRCMKDTRTLDFDR